MQTTTVTITRPTTARYFEGEDLTNEVDQIAYEPGQVVYHGAGAHLFDGLPIVVCHAFKNLYMVLNLEDVELEHS